MSKLTLKTLPLFFVLSSLALSFSAQARPGAIQSTQKTTEAQLRGLIEPLLEKYCPDQCKLLSVSSSVDVAVEDNVAPGFDDINAGRAENLAATSAKVKVLIDDKVGPVSRRKLLDLVQQYLDTLDYPVKIDTQIAHFPTAIGSVGKATELRERVIKQFKGTLDSLFQQFCPKTCLLADFDIQTDVVNGEEAQYGSAGEYVQDGDIAIKIKDISGTILVDDLLSPEERGNILEMAKLKTNYLKNVSLTGKSLKFPHPASDPALAGANGSGYITDADGNIIGKKLTATEKNSKEVKESNLNANSTNNNNSATNSKTDSLNQSNNVSKNESKSQNSSNNTQQSQTKEENLKQEKFERFEKIERVENGDAVQAELAKFKVYGLIFACSVLSLLIFLIMTTFKSKFGISHIHNAIRENAAAPPAQLPEAAPASHDGAPQTSSDERITRITKRYEIERLTEELLSIYAQQPKVAKQVFSRVLTEEGVEATADCIHLFGESIVLDMLRDPSLQSDISELMEYYVKNLIELSDDEKLEILKNLHQRTVAAKLIVMGNRSSNLFDFLSDMDGMQILELIRTESLTVKSIVITQCDPQKRAAIYGQLDEETRMKLLQELSRIDYLPRDYVFNVANALKRKRKENPKLNTEALPGSEVLINLLEKTGPKVQKTVIGNLEYSSPESARMVKSKLISVDTLRFLRDGQLLEVVLSLKHDELLQFLKGATEEIRRAIFEKSPKELITELEEELQSISLLSRETYQAMERKVINRIKSMSNEGLINLVETNERMFAAYASAGTAYANAPDGTRPPQMKTENTSNTIPIKKASGW